MPVGIGVVGEGNVEFVAHADQPGKSSDVADLDLAICNSRDVATEIQFQGFAVMPNDTLDNLLPFRRKQSWDQSHTERAKPWFIHE
jgi:hypothetical protein